MTFLSDEDIEQPVKKNEVVNSLWVEKYRPKKIGEYIGSEEIKKVFAAYIENKDIPHLLLKGPSGTGKTSLAKILTTNIPCDWMYINASDESGIDSVRTKIKGFASTSGFHSLKVLILDESDRLTMDAQQSLRSVMEVFSATTRFILTCNYPEKIIPAILSRCQTFEIRPISKKDIALKLVSILNSESIKYSPENIKAVVEESFPDVRKAINFAQQNSRNGELVIVKESVNDENAKNQILEALKRPSSVGVFNGIRQIVVNSDFYEYDDLYKFLFDNIDEFAKGKEAECILAIADSLQESAVVINNVRDIPFLACVYKLIKILGGKG